MRALSITSLTPNYPEPQQDLAKAFDVNSDGSISVGELGTVLEEAVSGSAAGLTALLRPGSTGSKASSHGKRPAGSEASVSTILGSEWDRLSLASRSTLADDIFALKFGGEGCSGMPAVGP